MKNKILIILLLFIATFSFVIVAENAYSLTLSDNDQAISSFLEEFVTEHPSRTAYSAKEVEAADFLAEKFETFGLETFFDGYIQRLDYYDISTQNVVGVLPSQNSRGKIVIGAHYDNVVLEKNTGASDNGSGIAVMLSLASKLKDITLDFDVIFAAWGAEEQGKIGSYDFLNSLSKAQQEEIMLYINLDSIACGDDIFAYAQNRDTDYCSFFVEEYNKMQYSTKISYAKSGTFCTPFVDSATKPYYSRFFSTDSESFEMFNIPFVSFFAGNLTAAYSYIESADQDKCVMHTQNDNFDYIEQVYGEKYLHNMTAVRNCVLNALTDEKFVDIVLQAKNQLVAPIWYSSLVPIVIVVVLLIGFALWSTSFYKRLRIKAAITDDGVKNFRIFLQPNDEEIFTFFN